MKQSPELKDKIREVYEHDLDSGSRIADYLGNTGYVLVHKEHILNSGSATPEDLLLLEDEYKKIVDVVLKLSPEDIVLKLNKNKPSKKGTNANIESLKIAFLN